MGIDRYQSADSILAVALEKKTITMKTILFILLSGAVFFSTQPLRAQDTMRTMMQKRDRIHQEDHFMFQNGKLYRMQNGVSTEVKNQLRLQSGLVVNPDGSFQIRDQERQQLRNGQCLDMNGNVYQNQRMYNQRHMMGRKNTQGNGAKGNQNQQKGQQRGKQNQ